ncbi:hypothetical protein HN865_04185 [Candidatus Woesearchaeota archaeon]|jgi:hypothetical protein|nr:hypothetical protein [Candidatus Woesearchaeota archaeon]MBT7238028.1 hypothetical protein [Candidatus Woesearchaeota archaeon]
MNEKKKYVRNELAKRLRTSRHEILEIQKEIHCELESLKKFGNTTEDTDDFEEWTLAYKEFKGYFLTIDKIFSELSGRLEGLQNE